VLLLAQELAASPGSEGSSPVGPISLYGGRSAADLPLANDLEHCSDLRLATEDGSRGAHGFVTTLLAEAIAECRQQGAKPAVYACGPQAMLAAVAQIATDHRAACQVSLEALMGCGYGVCLGCPTPRTGGGYLYTCTEGPCVDAGEVAWTEASS
jgi:dihydroorotate dehydrogenase electron transfer subunit